MYGERYCFGYGYLRGERYNFQTIIFEHFLNNISYKIHTNTWNNIYPTDNNKPNQTQHYTIIANEYYALRKSI